MSLTDGNLDVQYILSKFDKKRLRTEFMLNNNSVYTSNLKLVNFGFTSETQNATSGNKKMGIISIIKRLSLLSNNLLIDACEDFQSLASYLVTKNSNETITNVNNRMYKSAYGVDYAKQNLISADFGSNNKGQTIEPEGMINLNQFLLFLSSTNILSTLKLPNLKLVVEYDFSLLNTDVGNVQFEKAEMVAYRVNDDTLTMSLTNNFKSVSYITHELEKFNVAENEIIVTRRMKGFNNKYLSYLLLMKEPVKGVLLYNGDASQYFKQSLALSDFKYEVLLNGRSILPFGTISGYNRMLRQLTNTMGEHTFAVGGHVPFLYKVNQDVLGEHQIFADNKTLGLIRTQSYNAVQIEDKIQDLQLKMQFNLIDVNVGVPLENLNFNQAKVFKVYAGVNKVLSMEGKMPVVSYA